MEVLTSLAETAARSSSLLVRAPTADNPYGPSAHETSPLAVLVLELPVSITSSRDCRYVCCPIMVSIVLSKYQRDIFRVSEKI